LDVDVVEGTCKVKQALIKDKRYEGLYLLPAAQTRDKMAVSPEQMKKVIAELEADYDYIIIDCPAGIEQGFKNAIAGAKSAIVVTVPEVSAVRDADRIIGLLSANGIEDCRLLVNRLRPDLVKKGDMLALDDTLDILGIELIGVVPEDERVLKSSNLGEPVITDDKAISGKAYRNITKRILGEKIPLLDMEDDGNLFKKLFGKK
jgi:septum site-determining protein MinD